MGSGPGASQRTWLSPASWPVTARSMAEDILVCDAMAQRRAENLSSGIGSRNYGHPPVCRPAVGSPALPSGYACQEAADPEDTVTARRVLLEGLARDADLSGLVSELAPLHPRDNTFPGEVFLHVAADALDWHGPARPTRCPWRDYTSGSCPSAPSAAGRTRCSST